MYYIYILYSDKYNKFYTGMSNNIDRRIQEHNSGQNKTTKAFIPWRLIFYESCENRVIARKREKYWKSGTGRDKRNVFIKNNIPL